MKNNTEITNQTKREISGWK